MHVLENGSLVIIDASKSDEGEYVCGASSTVGSITSSPVRVRVRIPAHFKKKFTSIKTKVREKVSLACEAYGDEPIEISWFKGKNFELISKAASTSGGKFLIQESAGWATTDAVRTSTLVMESPSLSDSGFYACTASNAFGREEMNFQLVVQSVPQPPSGLKVKEVGSRGMTIAWKEPADGNSAIVEYLVHYKRNEGEWLEREGLD